MHVTNIQWKLECDHDVYELSTIVLGITHVHAISDGPIYHTSEEKEKISQLLQNFLINFIEKIISIKIPSINNWKKYFQMYG